MLEHEQAQLIAGLRELYRRLISGEQWPGDPLIQAENGNPLTHDILERLGLLYMQDQGYDHLKRARDDEGSEIEPTESGASSHRRNSVTPKPDDRGHYRTHSLNSCDDLTFAQHAQALNAYSGTATTPTLSHIENVSSENFNFLRMVEDTDRIFSMPFLQEAQRPITSGNPILELAIQTRFIYDEFTTTPVYDSLGFVTDEVSMAEWSDCFDQCLPDSIAAGS